MRSRGSNEATTVEHRHSHSCMRHLSSYTQARATSRRWAGVRSMRQPGGERWLPTGDTTAGDAGDASSCSTSNNQPFMNCVSVSSRQDPHLLRFASVCRLPVVDRAHGAWIQQLSAERTRRALAVRRHARIAHAHLATLWRASVASRREHVAAMRRFHRAHVYIFGKIILELTILQYF